MRRLSGLAVLFHSSVGLRLPVLALAALAFAIATPGTVSAQFVQQSPPSGTTDVAVWPEFRWGAYTDPGGKPVVAYHLCIVTELKATVTATCPEAHWLDVGNVTTSRISDQFDWTAKLRESTTYYWTVRAQVQGVSAPVNMGWFWHFTTVREGFLKLESPTNYSTGWGATVTLTWPFTRQAVGNEFAYCIAPADQFVDTCTKNRESWHRTSARSADVSGLSRAVRYKWMVETWPPGWGVANWEVGTFTTQIDPPGAFQKLSPANLAVVTPYDNVLLTWSSSAGADSYEYCLDTIDNNACDGTWTAVGTETSVRRRDLLPETTYSWQVRAIGQGGRTLATPGWSAFTTERLRPGDFGKTGPVNGVTEQPTTLTLSWAAAAGAVSYEYCIDTVNDGVCTGNVWTTTFGNRQVDITKEPDKTYYWQVRANNGSGATHADGGIMWAFRTAVLPGAPDKSLPRNGATGVPKTTSLSWIGSPRATSYEYCIDTFNNNSCDGGWFPVGTDTSVVPPTGLGDGTDYYWQVRARNQAGVVDGAGGWWHFKTTGAPGGFEKTSPAANVTSQPTAITLTWGASAEAASYEYCIDTVNNDACDLAGGWVPVALNRSVAPGGLQPNQTYYWQVRAKSAAGTTYANAGVSPTWWMFHTLAAPAAFLKETPSSGATGVPTNPTLHWESSQFAASYEYCLAPSSGACGNHWVNVGNSTSVTLPTDALAGNSPYYWQVRAVNVNGTTAATGGIWSFTTVVAGPGSFGKVGPADGTRDLPGGANLSWTASANAATYEYCVSTSKSTCVGGWQNAGAARTVAVAGLGENMQYYWQVRGRNASGLVMSDEGVWWGFTTLPPQPGAFSKQSPASASTGLTRTPTLSWTASSQAASYEYCVSTSTCLSGSTWTSVASATTVTLPALDYGTRYYWDVRARNAAGTTLSSGGNWYFNTQPAPPGAFTKSEPANGAASVSLPASLAWNASTGATSYQYCISINSTCTAGWTAVAGATSTSVAGLNPGTTYYWQVRASNDTGVTEATGGWTRFTTQALPAPFSKTAPPSRARGVPPTDATLSWGPSDGRDSFEYCIDQTNNNLCDSGVWISRGTASFVTLTTLTPLTTYYWNARAKNVTGTTEANGGSWWSFTTQGPPAIITWPAPAPITYGTPLSAAQLNASADIPGTFVYSPALQSTLHAGTGQTLTATFTPQDAVSYPTVVTTRTIDVLKATATLAFGPLTVGYDGAAVPVSVATTPAGLTGVTVTYDGTSTVPAQRGSYAVAATLTHRDYQAAPINGTLQIVQNSVVTDIAALTVAEGGTGVARVKLSALPGSGLTVTVARTSGDADVTVSDGATLHFGPANWNSYQTVTFAAAEDPDVVSNSATFALTGSNLTPGTVNATEIDNDTLSIVTNTTALTLTEGHSATFQVKLGAQPPNSIDLTVARLSGDGNIAVTGGAALTFTTANWNVFQTVTLSAGHDPDLVNGSATIRVSGAGLAPKDVTATEADDDTLQWVVSVDTLTVPEGSSAAFDVRLNVQPQGDVTATISRLSGDADLTVAGGGTLTFTPANWSVGQRVTLSAAEDVDVANGTATFRVAGPGATPADVTAAEADNDVLQLLTNTASLAVPEGGTATFQVKLSRQPSGAVAVGVSRLSGDPDLSVSGGTGLVFDQSTWNTFQTVTLSAGEDGDVANGTATIRVSSAGLADVDVAASEVDNDTLSFVISTSALTITEGGAATFQVRLNAQPAGPVTATVSRLTGDGDVAVSAGATLTFTTANWSVDQTVTLGAGEDVDVGNGVAIIRVSAAGLSPRDLTVTEADNDLLSLVTDVGAVTAPEGGQVTFRLKLSAQPASPLSLSVARVSGDVDLSVTTGSTLVFDASNWDTYQTVTVAAADDPDADNGAGVIRATGTGVADKDVTATEADDDSLGIVVVPAQVDVPEGGTSTFRVSLGARPAGPVTVAVARAAGDGDISVSSSATLTFTSENWGVSQAVTLSAAQDLDAVAGVATIRLTAPGLAARDVAATERDDDAQGIVVSTNAVAVAEGATTTFQVQLAAQPPGPLTVTLTASGDADITASPGTLAFSAANWSTPQTVTVAAAEDPDAANGVATVRLGAPGVADREVTATEGDNDNLRLVVNVGTVDVAEGGKAVFQVKLSAAPPTPLLVNVTRAAGDADIGVVLGTTLVFSADTWSSYQTVGLFAAEDSDVGNGSAIVRVSANGVAPVDVAATEVDNDTMTLQVSDTSVTVPEGGSVALQVRLGAQPVDPVVVSVNRTSGDASVGVPVGATLTFTRENWGVKQTITLAAAEDDDVVNGTATFTLSGGGAEAVEVTATEADNDSLAVVTSVPVLTVAEGRRLTFQVRLNAQPSGPTSVSVEWLSGDADITVAEGGALVFTPDDWNVGQPVTLAAAEDADALNGTAVFRVGIVGGATTDLTATEADNETQQFVVSTNTLTVPEGGNASFQVKLSQPVPPGPGLDVIVGMGGDGSELDISVAAECQILKFTADNWDIYQTVKVLAAEDADAANGSVPITISAGTVGPPLGIYDKDVVATEVDNDRFAIETDTGAVAVTEGGTATFRVRLTAKQPSWQPVNVTVANVAGDSDLSVSGGASLVFTTENWNVFQTVTVSAGEDADVSNGVATIRVSAPTLTSRDVTAAERDNDVLALVVSTAALPIGEGGSGTFQVKLTRPPESPLAVSAAWLTGDRTVSVSDGGALTFTAENWDTYQTVTVAAGQDADAANGTAKVRVSGPSLDVCDITVTVTDDDTLAFVVDPGSVTVYEGGGASFIVRLTAEPAWPLTAASARVSGDPDIRVSAGSALTFSSENWAVWQKVVLAGDEDRDATAGTATIRVAGGGLADVEVVATEVDNDSAAPVFSDSPIAAGTSRVRAVNVVELRQAIAALRDRHGLPVFSWSDPSLQARVTAVRLVHLTEMRDALAAVYVAIGRPLPVYTDANPSATSTVIKAVHIEELRSAVLAIW